MHRCCVGAMHFIFYFSLCWETILHGVLMILHIIRAEAMINFALDSLSKYSEQPGDRDCVFLQSKGYFYLLPIVVMSPSSTKFRWAYCSL